MNECGFLLMPRQLKIKLMYYLSSSLHTSDFLNVIYFLLIELSSVIFLKKIIYLINSDLRRKSPVLRK